MRKLEQVWMAALEQAVNPNRDTTYPILRVKYPATTTAEWGRNELYKIRTRWRERTSKGLHPSDPAIGTSPFDKFKLIVIPGEPAYIEVWEEDYSPIDFEIELPKDFLAALPRKYSHRKSGNLGKDAQTTPPPAAKKKPRKRD